MMDRDSFRTVRYRAGYIHTCYDRKLKRDVVVAQLPPNKREFKTVRGAKRWITLEMRKNANEA